MAERNGPTDGKRFSRSSPSGNHIKPKNGKKNAKKKWHKANGPVMNRGAGETMWTQELQDKIIARVRAGNYIEVAARSCGIPKQTFYDWLLRGGRGEQPFKALADAVEDASAEAELRDATIIGQHATTHWQAAAWRLERHFPKRWGRKDHLEIAQEDAPARRAQGSRTNPARLTPEERALFIQLRNKMRESDSDLDDAERDDESVEND